MAYTPLEENKIKELFNMFLPLFHPSSHLFSNNRYEVLSSSTFPNADLDSTKWNKTMKNASYKISKGIMDIETTNEDSVSILQNKFNTTNTYGYSYLFEVFCAFSTPGEINNIRRVGVYNVFNGVFFELAGPIFRIGVRSSSQTNYIEEFNGDYGSSFEIDTNFHVLEISFNSKEIVFYIDKRKLHSILLIASNNFFALSNFSYMIENNNSGVISSSPIFSVLHMNLLKVQELVNYNVSHISSDISQNSTIDLSNFIILEIPKILITANELQFIIGDAILIKQF